MVVIYSKSASEIVNFPKTQNLDGDLVLTFHSELTQNDYSFDVVDLGTSKRFYKFELDLTNVPNGEFAYNINGKEQGLVRVGDVSNSTPEIVSFSDEYEVIQYTDDNSTKYKLQRKDVTYTANGKYTVNPDLDYYGLKSVSVNVDVPMEDYWQSGYTSGYTNGYASGKTDGYSSGYTKGYTSGKTDGFGEGYVSGTTDGKQIGYNSGWTGGYNSGKNDGYSSGWTKGYASGNTDGYNNGKVDGYNSGWTKGYTSGNTDGYNNGKTDGYDSGYTKGHSDGVVDGIAEQKSKLIGTEVITNGTIYRTDGWSAITVNVHTGSSINNQNKGVDILENGLKYITYDSGYTGLGTVVLNVAVPTGHTDAELEAAYNNGYTSGKTDGYSSGWTGGRIDGIDYQKSLLSHTAITQNQTVTSENGFSSVTVNVRSIDYYHLTVYVTSDVISGVTNNAVVTMDTSQETVTKTFTGSPLTFDIIPGLYYSISFSDINGYNTPNTITGTSMWGAYYSVTGNYEYKQSPSGYTGQYFTLEFISGGTIAFNNHNNVSRTIEYSLNDGAWTSVTFSGVNETSVSVNAGDKMRLRGNNAVDGYASGNGNYCNLATYNFAKYKAYGNFMSMLYGDNFEGVETLELHTNLPLFKFIGGNCVDAENMVLPATGLTTSCYAYMFANNGSITKAPTLPATTLVSQCYAYMFNGCSSLNYIKCLATDKSASYCTYQWVKDVPNSGGVFTKAMGVSWDTGNDGIPTNWTVIEE